MTEVSLTDLGLFRGSEEMPGYDEPWPPSCSQVLLPARVLRSSELIRSSRRTHVMRWWQTPRSLLQFPLNFVSFFSVLQGLCAAEPSRPSAPSADVAGRFWPRSWIKPFVCCDTGSHRALADWRYWWSFLRAFVTCCFIPCPMPLRQREGRGGFRTVGH